MALLWLKSTGASPPFGADGCFAQFWCRGAAPLTEQWITSPAGRRWNVIGTGYGAGGLRPPSPFKRGESRTGSGGSC